MKLTEKLTPTILLSIVSIGIILACGPYSAPRLLYYKSTVIDKPASGVDLMFPKNKLENDPHSHLSNLSARLQASYDADIADLKMAAPDLAKNTLEKYAAIRSDMIVTSWDCTADSLTEERTKSWLDEDTLAAIPKEFSIYLRGSIAYRMRLTEKAREHWKSVLALPANERKYKTIWAAWMLARTSTAKGEAMQWYAKVKQFKTEGFPDSIHVTSKDWTSFFSLKSGDYSTALDIYIKEGKEEIVDSVSAANNIRDLFYQALYKNESEQSIIFEIFAKNKEHAIALSYYLANYSPNALYEIGDTDFHQKEKNTLNLWIKALQESKRPDIDHELGICATSAYSMKDEETMNICLAAMKRPTTDSLWIQAKLQTIKGDLTEAAKIFQKAIVSIKDEDASTEKLPFYGYESYRDTGEVASTRLFYLYSEYACVELGLKHYDKALDLFLSVNNQADAAYIAETILSSVELLDYVRKSEIAKKSDWIKSLLTRKLMRNGYFNDAKTFAFDEHLDIYDSYIDLYRIGNNEELDTNVRAQAFADAAEIVYDHGHELFYLENDSRPLLRILAAGRTVHENYNYVRDDQEVVTAPDEFTPKITSDELNRIKKNYIRISPVRTKDIHAAELLYRAAMLLPKNDKHAAKFLWQAGDWTRPDPQVADKYYQTLVKRCPNTALGKACDERRWFIHAHEIKADAN